MQVLIVDDSRPTRKVMARMLDQLGHETVEASHGKEALDQLKAHPDIGLMMLDWNMPEMNGIELLEALKAGKGPAVKPTIIMCTTENAMGKIVQAMVKGANEYIMKPFTKEILEEKLAILGIKGGRHV
ncbi:response regulator [bacterium AH-315-L15]|nr:response regulator [bacterium AH-315-L15]